MKKEYLTIESMQLRFFIFCFGVCFTILSTFGYIDLYHNHNTMGTISACLQFLCLSVMFFGSFVLITYSLSKGFDENMGLN